MDRYVEIFRKHVCPDEGYGKILPHYSEILSHVRMPVYGSLCDVLRGPAGRKLYEILRKLHEADNG